MIVINKRLCLTIAALAVAGMATAVDGWGQEKDARPNQYEFENIVIPAASADEPTRPHFSLKLALDYVENGASAWAKSKKCIACHTTGLYMVSRPELTPHVGKPPQEMRAFFVDAFEKLKAIDRKKLSSGIRPTQLAYVAGGLAEWDAHVSKELSAETDAALRLMFEAQAEEGSFSNANCWPPHESSAYQGATVAAMAAATAPGWLDSLKDEQLLSRVEKLKAYLRTTPPPHDYGRLLLLWTSTRLSGLLDEKQTQQLIGTVWKHQREDGGWSIRTFAAPEEWGGGNRAKKLRAEPEFNDPPSDGHQTGLAVLVLRDSGVPADDARIQKAVQWLRTNQQESGRWWTRSLNTDRYHFITYSGTCYPLLALAKCNVLPPQDKTTASK